MAKGAPWEKEPRESEGQTVYLEKDNDKDNDAAGGTRSKCREQERRKEIL
jgi:hypothetical protein